MSRQNSPALVPGYTAKKRGKRGEGIQAQRSLPGRLPVFLSALPLLRPAFIVRESSLVLGAPPPAEPFSREKQKSVGKASLPG